MTKASEGSRLTSRLVVWLTIVLVGPADVDGILRGQQSPTGAIEGRVTISSIAVGYDGELTATNGPVSRTTPLVKGRFRVDGLAPGVWHLTLPSTTHYRAASRDVVVAAGQLVMVQIDAERQAWWVRMADNFDSPQTAVANTIGTDAVDCGQFGPDVQEAELRQAIACAQAATRERKAFFVIQHDLVPDGTTFTDNHVWIAEGLVGNGEDAMQQFQYRGSSIHVMRSALGTPSKAKVSGTICLDPRLAGNTTGTPRIECS